LIFFEVRDEETVKDVLERVVVIQYAESLGGVKSLVSYSVMQTHADVPEEQREAKLRLSVGLEAVDCLIADFRTGIGGAIGFAI